MAKRTLTKRILIVGPPASGKSSIAKAFVDEVDGVPHFDLDTEVLLLCDERAHSGPLSDDMIDEAVMRVLQRSSGASGIVELPHHDYISLINRGLLKFSDYDLIVLVRSDFSKLRSRELTRNRGVPLVYIARCTGAAAALSATLSECGVAFLEFDTNITPPMHVALCILDYIRKDSSKSLGKIEIAPIPDRPYLGGSLLNGVEWDDILIDELLRNYRIRTVLDVGCGAGGTIEKFARLGIDAWGIDGIVRDSGVSHRIMGVDFTRQWIEWPQKVDMVWCVEVLEHVAQPFEGNLIRTIASNTQKLAFITAAPPSQPGFHHVNCQPQDYWIERFEAAGLRYVQKTHKILSQLGSDGPFGMNVFKNNGMLFEVVQ